MRHLIALVLMFCMAPMVSVANTTGFRAPQTRAGPVFVASIRLDQVNLVYVSSPHQTVEALAKLLMALEYIINNPQPYMFQGPVFVPTKGPKYGELLSIGNYRYHACRQIAYYVRT